MAQRRMFSKKVTDTDLFLDMPLSAQALYFHLNMHADDDGFIGNPKTIQRMVGSSNDDLKLLVAKQFVLSFESGVIVIKDWKIHNYIRKDTYNKTIYTKEVKKLIANEVGQYIKADSLTSTDRPRDVDETLTQVRLGKVRIGKDRLGKCSSITQQSNLKIINEMISIFTKKTGQKSPETATFKSLFENGMKIPDLKDILNWSSTWSEGYTISESALAKKYHSYLNAAHSAGFVNGKTPLEIQSEQVKNVSVKVPTFKLDDV